MFRPCLAIFRSQCWRHTQKRKNTIVHIHIPQKPSTLEPHPHRTSTQNSAANQPDTPRFYTPATHMPLPCQAQYRPHMNHTTQESPGIPQQPQQTIFSQNLPSQGTRLHRNSPKLQHCTKHPSPRTSRPQIQNHPPDSNMSLTMDCKNEILLPII
jgi:hypothetical protein